ncbi:MAG: 50S ribosomal protein L29 [Patescibacteria group bacterium]
MAKKLKENLNKMTKDELKKELNTIEEKLRLIRFKAEGAKSKNVKEYGALKKTVARILTALNK